MENFENFCQAYIECALWAEFGSVFDASDLSEDTENAMRENCRVFFNENKDLMSQANTDFSQHGHDFWLSQHGHGAGFFCRGYGDIGDKLQEKSHIGKMDLYLHEGKIYH